MARVSATSLARAAVRLAVRLTGIVAIAAFFYGAAALLLSQLLLSGHALDAPFLIADGVTCLCIALLFRPLRGWLETSTERLLFRQDWERQKVLRDIGRQLDGVIGLDEALGIVMRSLIRIFGLRHAAAYVFQAGDYGLPEVKRVRQLGYASTVELALHDSDFVTLFFARRETVLLVRSMRDELAQPPAADTKEDKKGQSARLRAIRATVLKKLDELEIELVIPLRVKGETAGLIALGPQVSGRPFDSDDLILVDLAASHITSLVEKGQLHEEDQTKSEFVSLAAHELLMPITAMKGYLSLILDDKMGEVDDKGRAYLDNVYLSAKRLAVLVRDMLTATKLEAGRLHMAPAEIDMGKLIQDSLKKLEPEARSKSLFLKYEGPARTPFVLADQACTAEAVENLVGNAIKYTPKGGVTVRAYFTGDGFVRVDVTDTGFGMPKEQQGRLFEKFYRVYSKDAADVPGTGLGLYITRGLIEQMGGTIAVDSTEGEGSIFSFILPAAAKS